MIDPSALGTLIIRQNADRGDAAAATARPREQRPRTRTSIRAAAAHGLRVLATRLDRDEAGAVSRDATRASRPTLAMSWPEG
jgi:hypothetical protein